MLLKRIREDAGITQVGMAHRAGVSKQHIMRIEQGIYAHLNPEIAEHYSNISMRELPYGAPVGYSVVGLQKEYAAEVALRRKVLKPEIEDHVLKNGGWANAPSDLADFREWLGYSSRIGFCKALACHPAAMLNYEKGAAIRLPSDLHEALVAVGVPETVIATL